MILAISKLGPWVKHVVPEGACLDPSKGWTCILSNQHQFLLLIILIMLIGPWPINVP